MLFRHVEARCCSYTYKGSQISRQKLENLNKHFRRQIEFSFSVSFASCKCKIGTFLLLLPTLLLIIYLHLTPITPPTHRHSKRSYVQSHSCSFIKLLKDWEGLCNTRSFILSPLDIFLYTLQKTVVIYSYVTWGNNIYLKLWFNRRTM